MLRFQAAFFLLFFVTTPLAAQRPDWVVQRPIDRENYLGIGSASVFEKDYAQQAKLKALEDLASEIMVNIDASSTLSSIEEQGSFKEKFESQIKTYTLQQLRDYELVAAWSDGKMYYEYYRLSKQAYRARLDAMFESALHSGHTSLNQAKTHAQKQNILLAVDEVLNASFAFQEVLNADLRTEQRMKVNALYASSYTFLKELFSGLQLKTVQPAGWKMGQKSVVTFKVQLLDKTNKPISLPLFCALAQAGGELQSNNLMPDEQALMGNEIYGFVPQGKTPHVEVWPDYQSIASRGNAQNVLVQLLAEFSGPVWRVNIDIEPLKIFLDVEEKSFGTIQGTKFSEAAIQAYFGPKGFVFVRNQAQADQKWILRSATRAGGEVLEMKLVYLDATVKVIDLKSNKELIAQPFTNLKGVKKELSAANADAHQKLIAELKKSFFPAIDNYFQLN